MKAAVIQRYKQTKIELVDRELPKIKKTDVLVKVAAASINPIDRKIKDGDLKMLLHYQFPLTLGSDFAGVIQAVGSEVQRFQVGDKVYGRVNKDRIGTFAEYLAVDQADIAIKPNNLTFSQAAAVPLVGLTSYQAIHDFMKLKRGDKVLIQAGSGGIGTVAIQLAKLAGAFVATTTSEKNADMVKKLGADQVIDYHRQDFSEVLTDFDYVFDTLGKEQLKKAFQIIRPGGKVVTLSGIPNRKFAKEYGLPWWKQAVLDIASYPITRLEKESGATYVFLFMKPSGEQLVKLTDLIESGNLQVILDRIVPLEQIQQAFDYSATGRAHGKIVLNIDPKVSDQF
ncbi:NADP-dependent oxidoreductase [Enterococcus sp. CSURQ0835]|uniref:NADP-dependent oxidoreductase n=1 Tax=Enterococcus sp. CSURQ0835 TaxID=2681394 RepID=UPI00190FAEE7|nr:NADP-dependent oxidoreductase [Enterococcus sp. CSURQ0835]